MDRQLRDDKQWVAACLKLAALGSLNHRSKLRLLEHYPHPAAIFDAPLTELSMLLQIRAEFLQDALTSINPVKIAQQLKLVDEEGIEIILYSTAAYPHTLRQVHSAPPVLFVQGNSALLAGPQIAMVGSRHASPSGLKTARAFAREFAASGLTVTSGLASGIDTAAHQGALKQPGSTVAIVATGLDEVYPRSNAILARSIIESGCMVSEFPPLTPARRAHFPQRNRIISGLSLGVLVVEADTRSGSLITARLAGEQGREVFAIPGSIHSPTSRGCHQLIRQGAKLVETTADVLLEIRPSLERCLDFRKASQTKRPNTHSGSDAEAQSVLNLVDFAPTPLEDIVAHSNLPIERVSSALLQLELAGRVSPLPGGQYQRVPD